MTTGPGSPEPPAGEPLVQGDLLDSPEAGGAAIRGSLVRSIGFGASVLLGLVTAPILTRYLGVEDFGRYSAVLSLIALIAAVTEAGLGALGVRELAVPRGQPERTLLGDLLGIRIVLTLAGVAVAIGFTIAAGYDRALMWGAVLAGAGLITYVVQGMFGLPLAVDLRLGRLTAVDLLRQFVYLLVVVALVVTGAGLAPLLGATIPGGIVGLVLTMWMVRGRVPWRPAFDLGRWRGILAQTLPIATAGAITSVYFRLLILLMSVLAPALQTGYFALSFRIIEVVIAVPVVLIGTLLPVLSRAAETDADRLAYGFGRTLEVAIITGAGTALAVAVGSPLAITFLTGHPEGPAVDVLRIQAVAMLPTFVNVAYGACFIAMRKHRDLIIASSTSLVVMVLVGPPLILTWGAEGAAVAAVVVETVVVACCVVLLHRTHSGMHPSLGVVPKVAVAVAVAAAAAVLIDVPTIPNIGALAIASAVYLLALAALRGFPAELVPALLGRR
jgi:O-antigen/teichoic acid export membrane protein